MLLLRKLKLKKVLLIDRLDSRERMDACLLSNDVLSVRSLEVDQQLLFRKSILLFTMPIMN